MFSQIHQRWDEVGRTRTGARSCPAPRSRSIRSRFRTQPYELPIPVIVPDSYLGPGVRETHYVPPCAAPARPEDLSSLVSVCQFDPLRDEGIDSARCLAHANVPTELILYPGTFHGAAIAQEATVNRQMVAEQIAALGRGLYIGAQL